MERAGSKNYCSRQLVKSGKLKMVKNEIILTLGSGDKMGHVKTMNKFGEQLSTKVITLDGKHKSFLKPRKDVNLILKNTCFQ